VFSEAQSEENAHALLASGFGFGILSKFKNLCIWFEHSIHFHVHTNIPQG
jgi:hypothetical protein